MKKRVEAGHPDTAGRRFDVLEKRGEPSQDFSRRQILRDLEELIDGNVLPQRPAFSRARVQFRPPRTHVSAPVTLPFAVGQFTTWYRNHWARFIGLATRFDLFRLTCPTPSVKIPFAGMTRKRSAPTFWASNGNALLREIRVELLPWSTVCIPSPRSPCQSSKHYVSRKRVVAETSIERASTFPAQLSTPPVRHRPNSWPAMFAEPADGARLEHGGDPRHHHVGFDA